jgi:hypothetical protein
VGSVTNPTGSVKGNSMTGLVDAYTGNWGDNSTGTYDGTTSPLGGAQAQAQHAVLLSDKVGACSREGSGGSYATNELTLRLTSIVYADLPYSMTTIPPAADLPLTFHPGQWVTTSEADPNVIDPATGQPKRYVHRIINPYFMKAKSNGGRGTDVAATSGTVVLTAADATHYAGSYDLNFNGDHITGSFDAPWC